MDNHHMGSKSSQMEYIRHNLLQLKENRRRNSSDRGSSRPLLLQLFTIPHDMYLPLPLPLLRLPPLHVNQAFSEYYAKRSETHLTNFCQDFQTLSVYLFGCTCEHKVRKFLKLKMTFISDIGISLIGFRDCKCCFVLA